jgi:5'-methylthioadenosine nucleosidase
MTSQKRIKTIAILIAMEAEAEPLITKLRLEKCPKSHKHAPLPSQVRSGFVSFNDDDDEIEIVVCTCGVDKTFKVDSVGTVGAALACYEVLKTHEPDVVVNCGTAGGFARKGSKIGDVYLIDEVKYHDRRIPIPGYAEYGVGCYKTLETPNLRDRMKELKGGVCTTGNSLDATDTDREMMEKNDASVKEMEACAIAHVCAMFNVPFLCVKAITDIVDGPHATQDEFLANLAMAGRRLQESIPLVIEFLANKELGEL